MVRCLIKLLWTQHKHKQHNTNCSSPACLHQRLVHERFPHRARCPGMLFPRSSVIQPSPSASSDNPWKLIFSTTILIDCVSLLFCTFIGFLQFRHRMRFRDSFCLASVFKCLFTYRTYLLCVVERRRRWCFCMLFSKYVVVVCPSLEKILQAPMFSGSK